MDESLLNEEEAGAPPELTLPVVLLALIERRRLLLAFTAAGILIGGIFATLKPTRYSVYTSFVSSPRRGVSSAPSALGGLAAQLGIGGVGDQSNQGPLYFEFVVKSRSILEAAVLHEYTIHDEGVVKTGRLPKFLMIEGDSAAAVAKSVDALRMMVMTVVNVRTVVTLKTTTPFAELSQQITQQLLSSLEAFNTSSRQSQAAAERQFVEGRVADMLQELRNAESKLQTLVSTNRDMRGSPALQFEYERQSREVLLRQQVYGVLVSAYEQARIDQLRDTPLLTIVEPPELPAIRDAKGRVSFVLSQTLLFLLFGIAFVVFDTARKRTGLLSGSVWDEVRAAGLNAIGRRPKST